MMVWKAAPPFPARAPGFVQQPRSYSRPDQTCVYGAQVRRCLGDRASGVRPLRLTRAALPHSGTSTAKTPTGLCRTEPRAAVLQLSRGLEQAPGGRTRRSLLLEHFFDLSDLFFDFRGVFFRSAFGL